MGGHQQVGEGLNFPGVHCLCLLGFAPSADSEFLDDFSPPRPACVPTTGGQIIQVGEWEFPRGFPFCLFLLGFVPSAGNSWMISPPSPALQVSGKQCRFGILG